MKENKELLNWLNRESSEEELMRLKKDTNFKTLEKIAYYSSQITTPEIDVAQALQDLNQKQQQYYSQGNYGDYQFTSLEDVINNFIN